METVAAAFLAQRKALLQAHAGFLQAQAQAHTAFLQSRHNTLVALAGLASQDDVGVGATALVPHLLAPVTQRVTAPAPIALAVTPAVAATATAPSVLWDRAALSRLASQRISSVLGPTFARQDVFARQVRMPREPLLLCDRVLSINATPGVLEKNRTIITQTDVRMDGWYLHEDRMPAGVLIEAGQADLLLISYMGVDFENRGERVYRLLGCDLQYFGHLPPVGSVLHYDIHIDGFATHGETRIFFFHSDCRLGGPDGDVVLSVRNGQAGFFTDEELLRSGGVLWKPEDEKPDAFADVVHDAAPRFTTRSALSRQELLAFADGDTFACFGEGFEIARTQVRAPRIDAPREANDPSGNPDGRFIDMLLVDRVTDLDDRGGPWGRGYLRAELDLNPSKWFYEGHFQDDPCMPGTIMFQGCLQVASTYLAACGFTLARDGFRFEPQDGREMLLRCRGQATPSSQHMVYELFVKSIRDGKEPTLLCDILVTVDGLKSLHCKNVEVRLAADWPLSSRPELLGLSRKADGKDAIAPRSVQAADASEPVRGFQSLIATGIGRPGLAFPGLYDVYDDGAAVARLPGPPYHFMSRVASLEGPAMGSLPRGEKPEGTRAIVAYDVPNDAWYFDEAAPAQGRTMPFAVLLEVALQPCGWLSSYVGSTRTSDVPLSYRNLDGKAQQHREVGDNIGTLFTTATMTKSSSSGGMIIQEFSFCVAAEDGSVVFDGTTVFGFFPPEALQRQVGVGASDVDRARLAERCPDARFPLDLTSAPPAFFAGPLALPAPSGSPTLLMIDRIEGAWRDKRTGNLRVRTAKDVSVDDWFFAAHFFQDPVQPGSLGIEAMVQALQFAILLDGRTATMRQPRFVSLAPQAPLTWKYRGQVVPRNRLIQVELDVTGVREDHHGQVWTADAGLWVDGLRIYLATGLALQVVDEG